MAEKRTIKVFIASPGDLAAEPRAFKNQIEKLNLGFGECARVEFVPPKQLAVGTVLFRP